MMYVLLYSRLIDAKRGCLQREGVSNPSQSAIRKAITNTIPSLPQENSRSRGDLAAD